jgi:3-oxoacyl-[acyl-carrier protein] reductase
MSDFLVNLGANPSARKIITTLGLPIPMPQKLWRSSAPLETRPLEDRAVLFGSVGKAKLTGVVAKTLTAAGADPWVAGDKRDLAVFAKHGQAWGRPPNVVTAEAEVPKLHALVFDATGLTGPADLKAMYEFFTGHVKKLRTSGRAVVLGLPPDTISDPAVSAAHRALEGFVRAMGKEVGRKGATSAVIYVTPGAADRLEPVLRFVLSARSAYVSGQPYLVTAQVKAAGAPALTRPLDGKVALVTGAARGIGADIARAFAREGAHVVVLDRPEDDAPAGKLAQEIGGSLLLQDITATDAPKAVAAHFKKNHGGLDIIVHNAGVTRDKMLQNMDEQRWDTALGVNLIGLIALNEALLPLLRENGRIVCLSSIAGVAGNAGQTNYSTAKAGVIGYVRAIAPKLAARGVAINAVAPGFIETRMTAAMPTGTREVARRLSSLGQGGLPADVAEVVTFLAGPGAAGLCGHVLRICGGNFVGA